MLLCCEFSFVYVFNIICILTTYPRSIQTYTRLICTSHTCTRRHTLSRLILTLNNKYIDELVVDKKRKLKLN